MNENIIETPSRKSAVLFIGNRYGFRDELISFLIANGIQIDCYGRGWENGSIDTERIPTLAKTYSVILGISNVGHSRRRKTLKLRDYESSFLGRHVI